MAIEFLGKDGVTILWQKINTLVDTKLAASGISSITTDDIYPVGSIYFSTIESFDPNTVAAFPGTWEKISEGLFMVTAGTGTDAGNTSKTFNGGQNSGMYTTSLSTSQLPSHTHGMEHTHTTTAQSANTTPSTEGAHTHTTRWNEAWVQSGTVKSPPSNVGDKTSTSLVVESGKHTHTFKHTHTISKFTGSTDGGAGIGAPINTTPPSFAMYAWRRIS